MMTLVVLVWSLGYGVGFEGLEDKKICFGIYTPKAEYGWVITEKEIYLDTIFIKEK